jgi:hypothetical protein
MLNCAHIYLIPFFSTPCHFSRLLFVLPDMYCCCQHIEQAVKRLHGTRSSYGVRSGRGNTHTSPQEVASRNTTLYHSSLEFGLLP